MNRYKLTIFTLLIVLFTSSAPVAFAQHWDYRDRAESNMSILVIEALIGEEPLVEGDEIAVFTEAGVLGGGGVLGEDDFPFGIAALSDDAGDGEDPNGFDNRDNNVVITMFWDADAEREYETEYTQIFFGFGDDEREQVLWEADDFYRVWLSAVVGPENPDIELNADAHDFGDVIMEEVAEWTLIISNVGRADLEVASVTLADGNDVFTIDFGEDAVVISPDESHDVAVTFTPAEIQDYEATITVNSDSPDEEELNVNLTGSGVDIPPPNLDPSAVQHNFGQVLAPNEGEPGEERDWTLSIENSGGSTLTIQDVVSGAEVFTTDFEGETDLEPGDVLEVVVTFAPDAEENYATDLTISSNDPDGDVEIRLTGQGVIHGDPNLLLGGFDEDEDYQYFFGNVVLGDVGVWEMVIWNDEDAAGDLHVTGIVADEFFDTDFDMEDVRLRPGDFYRVEVTFTPDEESFYEGSLSIESNDPDGDVEVLLGGVGTEEEQEQHFDYFTTDASHSILVESVTLDDESLVVGDEIGVFTEAGLCAGGGAVQDDGEVGMRAGVTAWGDDGNSDIIDGFEDDEPFTFIVWDADADLEVEVIGEGVEFISGPEVFENDGFSRVNLEAVTPADPPVIELSAMEHFFGQVLIDDNEEWIFTISNVGASDLEVQPIESDLNEYITDFGDDPQVIAPDESIEVTAAFLPGDEVQYEGRLTITSNDPENEVLFLDLFGEGVLEVNEQNLVIEEENYFFGAVGIGREGEYALTLHNEGGGEMVIFDITADGDDQISTDFGGRRRVAGGGSTDLMLTLAPDEEVTYHTTLTIVWNDPENENLGEVEFEIWGDGQDSDDHFLHRITDSNHSFIIQEALWVVEDRETALIAGDEVAIFTQAGLCAGHSVVEEPGEDLGLAAFGNDGNVPYVDGFENGEEFTFVFYDFGTEAEVEVDDVRFIEGDETFNADALTAIELRAGGAPEAQIVVDPLEYFFGPIGFDLDDPPTTIFTVTNSGEEALTVERVVSDLDVFTTNFGDPVDLEQGESTEIEVTFDPTDTQIYYADLTIFSSDPDEGEYIVHPIGLGSDFDGHYRAFVTDRNHSILMQDLKFGDEPADIGDEVGVFTEAGYLAGRGIVEDRGEVGIAAFGDDPGTEEVVEGFVGDEAITLRFWDADQQHEYIQGEDDIDGLPDDPILWEQDGFTVFENEINIEGIIVIIVEDLDDEGYREDDEENDFDGRVTFSLRLSDNIDNPQWVFDGLVDGGDMRPDNGDLDDEQNFVWDIDNTTVDNRDGSESATFDLQFHVTGDNGENIPKVVQVLVHDVDLPISPTDEAPDIDDEDDVIVLEEDGAPWVGDINGWFADPDDWDGDMVFTIIPLGEDPDDIVNIQIDDDNIMTITPEDNMSGACVATIRADNRVEGRDFFNLPQENVRSARSVRNDGPRRDEPIFFDFNILVIDDPDAPIIETYIYDGDEIDVTELDEVDAEVDEGQELVFSLTVVDVDTEPEDLEWVVDPGELPDGWETEVDDEATITFTWTPQEGEDGAYDVLFTVTDPEDQSDAITVHINAIAVNQDPIITEINDEDVRDQDEYGTEVNENEELVLQFEGFDGDEGHGDDILWWADPEDPWEIDENGRFTWTPGFEISGTVDEEFAVNVFAGDGEAFDRMLVNITVINVNREPAVEAAIDDMAINEDSGVNVLDDNLNDNFSDADVNVDDDALTFTAVSADPDMLMIDEDAVAGGELLVTPAANYHGDPIAITVTATDRHDAAISFDFNVTVNPINDAPTAFNLLTPENDAVVQNEDETVDFTWEASENVDFEDDNITYDVTFTIGEQTYTVEDLDNNEYSDMNVDAMLDELGLDRSERHDVSWTVVADDNAGLTTEAANASFTFVILLDAVNDLDPGVVTEFYMSNSYPNPFNESTTVEFGLPIASDVVVSVWDMHGRKIAELASGHHAVGRYEAVWHAGDVTSGVYIIRFESEQFQAMRKAILLR